MLPFIHLIDERKLGPSRIYAQDSSCTDEGTTGLGAGAKHLALQALEEEMGGDLIQKYEERLTENYDMDIDPLYNTWKKLKLQQNPGYL